MKFRPVQGFMVVDVFYGGIFPMSLIFDTGAQNTVIFDKVLIDKIPINYDKEVTLLGADMMAEIKAYIARNLIFQIGESPLFYKDAIVLREDHLKLSENLGENIHGIMGADFTKGLIVKIDYPQHEIILYSTNKINPKRYNGFKKIETTFDHGKVLIASKIIMEKKDTTYVNLLLDTGAGIAAMFHKNTHDNIRLPPHYINGNLGKGMGGDISGVIGKVDQLAFGEFSFHNLVSYYQDVDRTYYDINKFTNRNGLIGNVVLNCFSVMIDYVKEVVYLKPNKQYKKEIRYDRSGIMLIAQGEHLDKILIHDILPNSPAEKAGLQNGDQILSVTWHHLEQLSINYISRKFSEKVGKHIQLKVKRGNKTIKCKMTLENLL